MSVLEQEAMLVGIYCGLTQNWLNRGVESFVVHGNHDPLDGRFSSINWPEGIHIFGATPSWKTATRNGAPLADIQGASYPIRLHACSISQMFMEAAEV